MHICHTFSVLVNIDIITGGANKLSQINIEAHVMNGILWLRITVWLGLKMLKNYNVLNIKLSDCYVCAGIAGSDV